MEIEKIKEFKAVGNTVMGILDDDAIAEGYDSEGAVVICQCCSIPGVVAEDVAQEIARLLNAPNAQQIGGMGFSLPPYEKAEVYR